MPGVPPGRAVARISPGAASPGCLQLLSRLNLAAPCSGCLPVSPLAGVGCPIPWAGLFPWDKDRDNIYSINIRQLQLAFFFLICDSLALLASQELFPVLTVARGSRLSPQKMGFSWWRIFSLEFLAS